MYVYILCIYIYTQILLYNSVSNNIQIPLWVLQVYGPSMLPTFNISGDFVLAEKISPWFGKVGRNDIVLIRSPEDPKKIVTKRVVGMEGDNVTYSINPESEDTVKTIVV